MFDVFFRDDPSDLRTKLFKTRMWPLSIISRSTNVDLETDLHNLFQLCVF